jgi:hypothetical protein
MHIVRLKRIRFKEIFLTGFIFQILIKKGKMGGGEGGAGEREGGKRGSSPRHLGTIAFLIWFGLHKNMILNY